MRPKQQHVYPHDPRSDVSPHVPPARVVVDVGCGTGGFGLSLRTRLGEDAVIYGIDVVPENVAESGTLGAYDLVVGGYYPDDVPTHWERPDLICFLDVLEHMVEPWDALRAARDHLGPGGRVLASVPNIQYWPAVSDLLKGRWDYTETGILDRTHLRFFTRSTLIEAFEQAGFQVDLCRGINSCLQEPGKYTRYRRIRRFRPDMEWLQFVVVATAR